MKQRILYLILIVTIMGCTKSAEILFCEGVSPEGEGVECGSKFGTGELTALVKTEEAFNTESLEIQISQIEGNSRDDLNVISIKTDPAKNRAWTNLSFYSAGTFQVKAINNDSPIAKSTLEVVDIE